MGFFNCPFFKDFVGLHIFLINRGGIPYTMELTFLLKIYVLETCSPLFQI